MAEWYAVEVGGAVSDLTSNLNALEHNGYEIFSVVISPRGWTIVARMTQAEQKPEPPAEVEAPRPSRRGTVTLHKPKK